MANLNKTPMMQVDLNFKYPMAVAAMGMGFASVASYVYCDLLKRVPAAVGVDAKFYWKRIFPVGACQGLTLFLGNQMYFFLTVAFIEMSRASLPVTTMIALWLARLETPTAAVIRAVCLTAVGCAIAAYGEVHLTLVGALLAACNLSMESIRLVMTQYLLVGCDMHPLQSLKFIAPAATLTLLVGSAIREYPTMVKNKAFSIVASAPFHFMLAAVLGLVVNVLGVVIIKLSSATTLKVLAAVRGPIVVMCSVMLFSEAVTLIEFLGYSMSANPQPAIRLPPATPNATANPQRKRTKSTNKIDAVGVPPGLERPHNPNEDIVWLTDACGGDFKSWAYALQGSMTVICFFCDTHKESNATISHTNWDRSAYTRHEASYSHKAAVDQYTQDPQQQQTDKHLAMTEVADNPFKGLNYVHVGGTKDSWLLQDLKQRGWAIDRVSVQQPHQQEAANCMRLHHHQQQANDTRRMCRWGRGAAPSMQPRTACGAGATSSWAGPAWIRARAPGRGTWWPSPPRRSFCGHATRCK
ncbi:hypothetical protein VOLCADRAFT_104385 [Volvox carteri f. nagariensis]|uniref:Sugar phosphate transporter domain-containing protein n=1 Tax=Volvox carteri f. nagariensis TaxID=3068 RepID=D8TTD5_VOLCA|nr:uncharacterized protein VOLCADRAFT_104385 [Volvox carteri f. nagariensis]EFJ49182.1 hypothetical protein VOLCADRAFT_104385 [Volvox carteri f. nagariensis]|eukprot:XP_002949630.1 hypothetical protein VOLCADRAFT_104385 [Volvox carteri f. nagariensis]